MGEAPVIVALRQEQLEAIMEKAALIGAQTASEIVIKEMAKKDRENKDRRLHNTRLLLEHYRDLKTHCKEAVYEAEGEQSESDMIESLMSVKDDTVILESIKRTTQRTQMMISHIDKMMDVFHVMCEKRGDREKRRYHVIYDYYIARNKKSLQRIADEYSVSRVTIYNDLKSAEEELSVFFFGVDGLHIETTLPTA